jgi:hypothetical protein
MFVKAIRRLYQFKEGGIFIKFCRQKQKKNICVTMRCKYPTPFKSQKIAHFKYYVCQSYFEGIPVPGFGHLCPYHFYCDSRIDIE